MSGLPVGIGVFDYSINKFYDKIPNKAFSGDTYTKPLKSLKRNSLSSSSSSRRKNSNSDSRRSSRDEGNGKRNDDRDRAGRYRGAAAGAAGGYAADELYDQYRQPAPRRRSEDGERNWRYNHQEYESDPNLYSQGDPNFGRREGLNENGSRGERERDMPRQNQQGQYYAADRANDYHRYNPRDYEPQGYSSDYAPARYSNNNQQDPYDRPQSAGPRDDRYERKEGRERRKSRSSRCRSKSGSPGGVRGYSDMRGMMKRNFEMSDTGLTTGALGALAGGLIGNEVGKGIASTIAGALIGGLGANAWEARDHRKKIEERKSDRDKDRRSRDDDRRNSLYDDRDRYRPQNPNGPNAAYVQDQNRGPSLDQVQARALLRQRSGDDGGAVDSDEERRLRREARRQRRAAKEEMKRRAEMGDPSLPWGDVLRY